MEINQVVKEFMKKHARKVELFQWAIMNSVAGLVYSEYVRRIRQRTTPTRSIMVPKISTVKKIFDTESPLIQLISNNLINGISDGTYTHPLFAPYIDAPEFEIFKSHEDNDVDNLDVLKTVLNLYIIPNVIRRIPETIAIKFGLDNPSNQLIRESNEIDLFERRPISMDQFKFIVDEVCLQLLTSAPSIKKNIDIPDDKMLIYIMHDEIIEIGNENAISPLFINSDIIQNKSVIDLLLFVTSTTVTKLDDEKKYVLTTNPFNDISLIRLNGIEVPPVNTEAN